MKVTDSEEDKRFRDLRKVADKFVRDYFFKEFEALLRATDRPVDKTMQERIVAYAAWNTFPKGTVAETEKHSWVAAEKKRLQDLPEAELREVLDKWHGTVGKLHAEFIKRIEGKPEETKAAFQLVGAQQIDLKQKLQQNEARLLDIKARQTKLMVDLNSAQKDLGNFRFFAAQAGGKGLNAHQGATGEQRSWLTDLCSTGKWEKLRGRTPLDQG